MSDAPEDNTHGGNIGFATTQWSVVLAAQGESASADAALEKLCRTYWKPLYAFVRREGKGVEEAQDLTQAFFARLLERRDFDAVQREKGRLRSYLLVALKNFLANEWQRGRAIKRGEGRALIPLHELNEGGDLDLGPADAMTADKIYERRWALSVLEQVLERLGRNYREEGNGALFDRFKQLLADEPDRPAQAQIAAELGMNENAVKQAYHRFRQRYRELLRDEIAQTVAAPGDVEDELRHLIAVLRS
jgi:RNA polymerase sigma-70 factor (ECF subfamily)